MSRYTKTVVFTWESFDAATATNSVKPGQWFRIGAERGQYLGKTPAGVFVVNWPKRPVLHEDHSFMPDELTEHMKRNEPLRHYAKRMGSR